MSAQDLPVVHRDSRCLGIGFAMSFVSHSGAFFRLNRLKRMMVAGVWPFDWLVFTHTDLHLCKCFLVAGYDRHNCCLPLVPKVQSSITYTSGDHVGQVYGNAGLCLERLGAPCIPWFCLLDHDYLHSQKLKQHVLRRCPAQT